jgi:hypothetical protein
MVFRIVSAAVTLLIYLGMSGGKAWAQYYPPAQAYPPPQAYPRSYHHRQPLPPIVDDADYETYDDMVYDLHDRPLGDPLKPKPTGHPRPAGDTGPPAPIAIGDSRVTATCRHHLTKTLPERALTTACPEPYCQARPIRPNRMQFGKRQCGRDCQSAPVRLVRDQ